MKTTKQIIGPVSSGTMREEDLIPTFLDALEYFDPARAKQMREDDENKDIFAWLDNSEGCEMPEEASYFLWDELSDALQEFAPPYFYFGSHPGDGADYGFWLCDDVRQSVKDNGGMVVSDLEDVPADFFGEVLHVNDHGNCTLFCRPEGSEVWSEIWSVV